MSAEYLRIRRLRRRRRNKKHVDRRASKGRKIRYQPHAELAVYLPPQPHYYPDAETFRSEELFRSLFRDSQSFA